MKVFIPTAGLGSRLWPLTRKLNKCLLTVDNKPVISHIIDCYPKSTKFVIAVGFDSKKVIDSEGFLLGSNKFKVRLVLSPTGIKRSIYEEFEVVGYNFIECEWVI